MHAFFFNTPWVALATGLLCLCLSGCDTAPTWVDQHFGQAVQRSQAQSMPSDSEGQQASLVRKLTQVQQQANPTNAPHETDGVSAKAAVDRYHESLLAPNAVPSVFNFHVGAGQGLRP